MMQQEARQGRLGVPVRRLLGNSKTICQYVLEKGELKRGLYAAKVRLHSLHLYDKCMFTRQGHLSSRDRNLRRMFVLHHPLQMLSTQFPL